jgi:hypothetical protein
MCLITATSSKPTENVFLLSQIKWTENELKMAVTAIAEYAFHSAAGCLPRIYFIPVSTEVCVSPSKGLFTKKLSPLERIYQVLT